MPPAAAPIGRDQPAPTPTAVPPAPPAGIWRPAVETTWQIQFTGALDTAVETQLYDLDLFDTDPATVAALHARGRKVVCYFSAGSYEDWRPDAAAFPPAVLGRSNG